MRVLVCGSRNWEDGGHIYKVLKAMRPQIKLIIQGGAKGADTLARNAAEKLRIPYVTFEADWEKHGKAAGPIRNAKMLKDAKPTIVLIFHDEFLLGKGSRDMYDRAFFEGLPIRIYPPRKTT